MNKFGRRAAGLAAAGLTCLVAGCGLNENGRAASLDQHTYHSTVYRPTTVTVLDTRDQQEIITIEVPVGSKLATRYYRNRSDNRYRPDVMKWSIHSLSHVGASLENEVAVPRGEDGGRLIVVSYRDAPELPPDVAAPPLEVARESPELPPLPRSPEDDAQPSENRPAPPPMPTTDDGDAAEPATVPADEVMEGVVNEPREPDQPPPPPVDLLDEAAERETEDAVGPGAGDAPRGEPPVDLPG